MKKLFPQLLILLFIGMSSYAQNINFSDPNFKKALLNHTPTVDLNKDGEISITEAKKVTKLGLDSQNISSLKEISYFINLDSLSCGFNNLKSLNVTKNTKLTFLDFQDHQERVDETRNSISELDLTQNRNLKELNCNYAGAINLDISNNKLLEHLHCRRSVIKKLNISNNVNLKGIDCQENYLTNLNISKNTSLKYLFCTKNSLTKLDISNNKLLEVLECGQNKLSSLNLSQNNKLYFLDFSSTNIKVLDAKNCKLSVVRFNNCKELTKVFLTNQPFITEYGVHFNDCPKLNFICVDKKYVSSFKEKCNYYGYKNCNVSSVCNKNFLIERKVKTAVESKFTSLFKLYPNPTTDFLNINPIKNNIEIKHIYIYNNYGYLVKFFFGTVKNINITFLNSGLYYIKIETNKGIFNSPFVVKK